MNNRFLLGDDIYSRCMTGELVSHDELFERYKHVRECMHYPKSSSDCYGTMMNICPFYNKLEFKLNKSGVLTPSDITKLKEIYDSTNMLAIGIDFSNGNLNNHYFILAKLEESVIIDSYVNIRNGEIRLFDWSKFEGLLYKIVECFDSVKNYNSLVDVWNSYFHVAEKHIDKFGGNDKKCVITYRYDYPVGKYGYKSRISYKQISKKIADFNMWKGCNQYHDSFFFATFVGNLYDKIDHKFDIGELEKIESIIASHDKVVVMIDDIMSFVVVKMYEKKRVDKFEIKKIYHNGEEANFVVIEDFGFEKEFGQLDGQKVTLSMSNSCHIVY